MRSLFLHVPSVVAVVASSSACGGGTAGPDAGSDGGSRPDADLRPALAIESVEDLGALPAPSSSIVGRDGGPGGLLGGRYLWTFGDTFLTSANAVDGSTVLSATGAWASPDAPLVLTQPVDASGHPAQLVPYTPAELAANQADVFNGWALWPAAFLDTGDAEGLLVFQRIKRTDGVGYDSMGVGTGRLAVDGTIATRTAGDLFAPPELFIPQQLLGDHVLAMACAPAGFLNTGCRLARALRQDAEDRAAYEFWDGAAWQPEAARATIAIDRAGNPPSITYNEHLGRYLAVNAKVLSSTMLLRTAERPEGPWDDGLELAAGDDGYLAPTSADAFNYVVIEHPALASPDGRSIVVSYSRPTAPFQGDVRLVRITLQ